MTPEIARAVELARFIVQLDEQFGEAFHNGNPDATTLATALLALAEQMPSTEQEYFDLCELSAAAKAWIPRQHEQAVAGIAVLDRILAAGTWR